MVTADTLPPHLGSLSMLSKGLPCCSLASVLAGSGTRLEAKDVTAPQAACSKVWGVNIGGGRQRMRVASGSETSSGITVRGAFLRRMIRTLKP